MELTRTRVFHTWRWSLIAALLAAGTIGAALAIVYVSRNHVDLVDRMDPAQPLYAQWEDAVATGSGSDASSWLASYFLTRRPPEAIKPLQAWDSPPEHIERVANRFLQGQLPRSSHLWNAGDRIDWKNAAAPQQFQLQRQVFLAIALAADTGNPDRRLIEKGLAFVDEWRRGNRVWPNSNRYAWNDDATSNRIDAQMLLMEKARLLGLSSRETEIAFLRSLVQHADRLMDESEHNYQTNHGLMQNCALLSIALHYPELDREGAWLQTAIRRMEWHLRETFSPTGVFLESPGYHWFATLSTLWFITACRQAGIELEPIFEGKAREMLRFAPEMLYPDRSVPRIGDTVGNESKVAGWPWESLPAWPELTALRASLQVHDRPPNEPTARLWPQAGYFVLRVPAPRWTADSAMMLTVKAGPFPRAHGHYDALSITLFGNGEPLLTGPGYPRHYDPERRRKLIATTAQSTVSVDGASQEAGASRFNFDDVRTAAGPPLGPFEFAAAQAQSDLYTGVTHRRTVFYGPSSRAILIVDELISRDHHTYRQHFRVGDELSAATEAGLLVVGRPGVEREPTLLRVHGWVLDGTSVARPPADVVEHVAEFVADGRALTYVALLDLANADRASDVEVADGSIVWRGNRGDLRIDLPMGDSNAYHWRPAGQQSGRDGS